MKRPVFLRHCRKIYPLTSRIVNFFATLAFLRASLDTYFFINYTSFRFIAGNNNCLVKNP